MKLSHGCDIDSYLKESLLSHILYAKNLNIFETGVLGIVIGVLGASQSAQIMFSYVVPQGVILKSACIAHWGVLHLFLGMMDVHPTPK